MSVRRVLGTEVEYGISVPHQSDINPVLASTQVVLAYAAAMRSQWGASSARQARWDYQLESPFRDARGYDLAQLFASTFGGSGEVDLDDLGAANVILPNGARLYVDHAHPEYSAPETIGPLAGVIFDKAGERIMEQACLLAAAVPGAPNIQLYKNNTDGKGASYGTHENYLCSRQTAFSSFISGLLPFFASRQVFCGAGRVGIGVRGEQEGFQLSQRADYIEVEVGLETTLRRGIINTRDEPHATAEEYRRLHVIIGDANLAEWATYLKLGTTALVLSMIEAGLPAPIALADPVAAVHTISHDVSLRAVVEANDGRKVTGLDIQEAYFEAAHRFAHRDGVPDTETAELLQRWRIVLDELAIDPMLLADRLDWPAKLRLLQGFRERDQLGWAAPRLALVDLQYADVRLDRGIYNRLVSRGSMQRLVTDAQVQAAVTEPPEDTRAYFRGSCVRHFPDQVAGASWDSVIFDLGGAKLVRIPTNEPLRGTKSHVGQLLSDVADAAELVNVLTDGTG